MHSACAALARSKVSQRPSPERPVPCDALISTYMFQQEAVPLEHDCHPHYHFYTHGACFALARSEVSQRPSPETVKDQFFATH